VRRKVVLYQHSVILTVESREEPTSYCGTSVVF
jgi:hypothetical protein